MPEIVNPEWAREVLTWWIEQGDAALAGLFETFCDASATTDAMLEREFQARRVIEVVLGIQGVDLLVKQMPGGYNMVEIQTGVDLARRALGHLAHAAETNQHIEGTSAPTMPADSLHPLVWDAAAKLWNGKHYSAAVQRAATFLNAHVQDLTGRRDLSDSALMLQAFSPNAPEGGKPRLRWPGEDSDLTVKAMRIGILQFAQGCFAAIRNPATHGTAEMHPQEALEQLAILSALARWIDQCDLLETETS